MCELEEAIFLRWLVRLLGNAVAVFFAAELLNSVEVESFGSAVFAALILSLINTFFRPVLVFLTFPITVVTFGLFLFVINTVTFYVTGLVVPGFTVAGFWGAFWGALIVSVVSWLLTRLTREK